MDISITKEFRYHVRYIFDIKKLLWKKGEKLIKKNWPPSETYNTYFVCRSWRTEDINYRFIL